MTGSLRVLIDARMLMGRFSGVARMVTRLVEHLAVIPNVRVVALCGNEPYEPWSGRDDLEMIVSDFSREHRSPSRRLWWETTRLHHWVARSEADVLHATWNTGVPWGCSIPAILTVHDLIPWDEPVRGLSGWAARACIRYSLRASVRRADRVITVSGFSADQIVRSMCFDPAHIRVIHNGVENADAVVATGSRAERPYLLYVGGHEPRKNLEAVFRATAQYWLRHDPAMELHVTGSAHQLSAAARHVYEHWAGDRRIQFLGSPGDADLAREYANATALLMLSRAEGFGLPVMEAMSYGCPVIAARSGALPEIVGNAGLLVDPDDLDSVVNAICRLVRPSTLATELVAKGRLRAANFTWKRAAEAYLDEYQSALSKLNPGASDLFPLGPVHSVWKRQASTLS